MAATGWTVLIMVLSLIPFSGADPVKSVVSDKVIHALFYLILTLLWYVSLKNRKIRHLMPGIFLFSVIYGIIIEVLQDITPFNREFEVNDIWANILGSLTGIIAIKIYAINLGIALKKKK